MALRENLAIIELTAHVHLDAAAVSLVLLEVIRRPVHLGVTKSLDLFVAKRSLNRLGVTSAQLRLVAKRRPVHLGVTSAQLRLVAKRRPVHLGATISLDRLVATISLEATPVHLGMKIKVFSPGNLHRKRAAVKVDNKQLINN
jgi:hypothetical protein